MTIYTKPGNLFGMINGKELALTSGDQLVLEYTSTPGEVVRAWQQTLTVLGENKVEYSEVPVKWDSDGKIYSDYKSRKNTRIFTGEEINEMRFITSADLLFRMWHLYWRATIAPVVERM